MIHNLIKTKNLLMTITYILLFISCQEEYVDITEPDSSIAITNSDSVASLVLKVVLKDGSYDNIIDKCSEVSIKFPYSIRIRSKVINVESSKDIENIEFEHFHEANGIVINYPVTVIYSDYSESVIANARELHDIQEKYNTNLNDDDIECIDFAYPIELSIFNTEYQKSEHVFANNDHDLFNIFDNISGLIVEINFPIQLVTYDGENITINDNNELESAIKNAMGSCDENDDVEFNNVNDRFTNIITTNKWEVFLYVDVTNQTASFSTYTIDFKEDNTIQASDGHKTIDGVWEIIIENQVKILKIEFNTDESPIVWLNLAWDILSISSTNIEMMEANGSPVSKKKLTLLSIE